MMESSAETKALVAERLHAMRHQESTSYLCRDYLRATKVTNATNATNAATNHPNHHKHPNHPNVPNDPNLLVNEQCREKICEWFYQVVDHCEFHREIVSIAMSYLDRYMAQLTHDAINGCNRRGAKNLNQTMYKLAAMSALHLAMKLYVPNKVPMSYFVQLSGGIFTEQHLACMEESLLQNLAWYVHPPTSMGFVRELLSLMPRDLPPAALVGLRELAGFLTEISVCDYFFVTKKPSTVAIASLFLALEAGERKTKTGGGRIKTQFYRNVLDVGIDLQNDGEIIVCYERLKEMYLEGGFSSAFESVQSGEDEDASDASEASEASDALAERVDTVSPVSVFANLDDA